MSEERDVIIGGNLIAVCPSTGKSMTIRIGLGNVQFIVRTDKEDESTERLLTAPWAMPRRHGDWDEALRMIGAFAQDYLLAKEERKEGVVVDFLQAKRERESGGSVAPTDKVRSTLEELGYDPDEPVNPAVDAIIEEALAGASEDDDDLDELFSPPKPLDWDAPVDCSRDFDHQVYFYVDGKLERKVEAPYHLNDSVLLVPGSRGGIGSFVLDSVAVPDCHRIAPWVRFVAAPKIQTEPEDGGEYNPLSLFDPTTDTLIIAYGDRNADDLMFTAYAEIWTAFEERLSRRMRDLVDDNLTGEYFLEGWDAHLPFEQRARAFATWCLRMWYGMPPIPPEARQPIDHLFHAAWSGEWLSCMSSGRNPLIDRLPPLPPGVAEAMMKGGTVAKASGI